jgi:hypothetical protein
LQDIADVEPQEQRSSTDALIVAAGTAYFITPCALNQQADHGGNPSPVHCFRWPMPSEKNMNVNPAFMFPRI